MFAKTDSLFRFRLLPPHVKTHSWKNGGERNFWWDLKQRFWMSLMIKNMITVSFSFWHYENFSGFFYTKVKRDLTEPWKVSHSIQWYFCTCPFKFLPSFVLVWRREAHLQQVPCVRSSLCWLSPALWGVCGFRVSSVAAQNWVFTTQIIPFFSQEVTHKRLILV